MELFETAANPMPSGAIVAGVRTRDGLHLRTARWPGRDPKRGTVAVAIGRSEFIEQYYEIVAALLERGFAVVIWDWRGQGQSDREIRARRRGHVSSFSAYRSDIVAVEAQILRAYAPKPWFGFGHSMGGAVLIDQAHDGTSPFERLVLSAPMIDLPLRYKTAIRALVRIMNAVGFGARLVPGGTEISPLLRGFPDNVLTRDRSQYLRLVAILTRLPDLAVGAPTVRWLSSAFDLMQRFENPFYAVETTVPILIVAAGCDRIVATAATERFALRLKAGLCLVVPGARHQLIMEDRSTVAQFWAAFDAFVPGETVPSAPAAPGRSVAGPQTRSARAAALSMRRHRRSEIGRAQ